MPVRPQHASPGEVRPARRSLVGANEDATPTAMSPLRRQNPSEEPGALAARAGTVPGGYRDLQGSVVGLA
jgi:hypothetical protein